MKTFDECLLEADGKKHLMLGNGFSVALFPKIFNYKTLSQNIESEHIKKLFAAFETNDFEFVMRRLLEAKEVVSYYKNNKDISKLLSGDIQELKNTLITVIATSHPAIPAWINEKQYSSCREFLQHFDKGKKYSFNYDLLLYWVYMHFKDDKKLSLDCDDGFRYDNAEDGLEVFWEIGREFRQTLYYLHGAMHIFSDGHDIEKLSYNNIGLPLAEQVSEAVQKDKFPVFISEGSTEHKLTRIKKNGYLARAFSSLKGITGNLFIFGHSLRDEDDHVFDVINEESRLRKIFISLFGDQNSDENQQIIAKVDGWRSKYERRQYIFYDASSAKVWDK